ncbi:MAG: hypothetical protein WC292_03515 [Clostridia bacterium]
MRPEGVNYDYYWSIRGNKANYYASGSPGAKCKIVVRDDQIYFVDKKKSVEYKVIYDEQTKAILFYDEVLDKYTGFTNGMSVA